MIILPAKITSSCFPSKTIRCYFTGKRYCECFLTFTLLIVLNEMYWVLTWKNNGIPNFANWNHNLMTFQQWNSKINFRPEYLECETELEFRFLLGSQKSEPKIEIPNLILLSLNLTLTDSNSILTSYMSSLIMMVIVFLINCIFSACFSHLLASFLEASVRPWHTGRKHSLLNVAIH